MLPEGSEILTDDEKLLHVKRWEGETVDLPTAIRALAKVHRLASDEVIDETEDWLEFADELSVMMRQMLDANITNGVRS